MRPLRVALISTPFVPVPPPAYGGTELIVGELAAGLRDAGHQVRLYTCGDPGISRAGDTTLDGIEVRTLYREPVWPPEPYHELAHCSWAALDVGAARRGHLARHGRPGAAPGFDVVHTHCPASLPMAPVHGAPMVYSVHHARSEVMSSFYALQRDVRFVCVSARQRLLLPEVFGRADVIHHGIDERRYQFGGGGPSVLFLGRLAREKNPHVAIDVARMAGLPIVLGGRPHLGEDDLYFDAHVRPRLALPDVTWLGEVDHRQKVPLLAGARALLFPIAWEEPFGLVMIEAMLSGTPVLALPRGSVPEVVQDGITGFVCRDAVEMAERLRAIGTDGFDRERCRRRALERFGRNRMVSDYLAVYARAVEAASELRHHPHHHHRTPRSARPATTHEAAPAAGGVRSTRGR